MNGLLIQPSELDFIKSNYLVMTDKELSNSLNRSFLTVANVRRKLNLLRADSPKPYSKDDMEFIKLNYLKKTDKEIAKVLNRTEVSICNVRYRFHFKRIKRPHSPHSFYIAQKVAKMKALIHICETTKSPYQKDKAMEQLKKLSGL